MHVHRYYKRIYTISIRVFLVYLLFLLLAFISKKYSTTHLTDVTIVNRFGDSINNKYDVDTLQIYSRLNYFNGLQKTRRKDSVNLSKRVKKISDGTQNYKRRIVTLKSYKKKLALNKDTSRSQIEKYNAEIDSLEKLVTKNKTLSLQLLDKQSLYNQSIISAGITRLAFLRRIDSVKFLRPLELKLIDEHTNNYKHDLEIISRKKDILYLVGWAIVVLIGLFILIRKAIILIKHVRVKSVTINNSDPKETVLFFKNIEDNLGILHMSFAQNIQKTRPLIYILIMLAVLFSQLYIYNSSIPFLIMITCLSFFCLYAFVLLYYLLQRLKMLCTFCENCNILFDTISSEKMFCIYLRNFSSDNNLFDETFSDQLLEDSQDVTFDDIQNAIDFKSTLVTAKSNHYIYEFIRKKMPVICLANVRKFKISHELTTIYTSEDLWFDIVRYLIDRSTLILFYISEISTGVLEELNYIKEHDLYYRSILILENESIIVDNSEKFHYRFIRNDIIHKFYQASKYEDDLNDMLNLNVLLYQNSVGLLNTRTPMPNQ